MEEKIKAIIEEMDDGDKIALWNESCRRCSHYDDEIYSMSEVDVILDGYSPSDIAQKIYYGANFNPNDSFFYFNGYANLVSFDFADDENSPFCLNDLVNRIMRNESAFGNDKIADVLTGEEDDEAEA